MNDPREWAKQIGGLIKSTVTAAFGPLDARVKALEDLPAPVVPDEQAIADKVLAALPEPIAGKDASPEQIAAAVAQHLADNPPAAGRDADPVDEAAIVERVLATMPEPKAGEPGKSVTLDQVLPTVEAAIAALPLPADGKSVTIDEVLPALQAQVAEAIAELPIPKDGADGKSVTIEDLRAWFEAEQARWALDFERRAQDVLQRAVDRIPAPRDALAVDQFDAVLAEDGRTLTVSLGAGELAKSVTLRIPSILDRGIFSPGKAYAAGDAVSWGGNLWLAQAETSTMPTEGDPTWRLAVRKGRDGRHGVDRSAEGKPVKLA